VISEGFLLTLTDSELTSAEAAGRDLVLRWAAAQMEHPRTGEQGYVKHLELWCLNARWEGVLTEAIGRVRFGQVSANGRLMSLKAPGQVDHPVMLSLELGFGTTLVVHADQLVVRFAGPPDFRASLAC
jgi:hypothetical protein